MMVRYREGKPSGRAGQGRRWVLLAWALMLAAVPVLAQSGGSYDLSWSTVDGGGGTVLAGGAYRVIGSVGQPDAGLLTGGTYALGGGFWGGGAVIVPLDHAVYVPVLMRNY